MNQGLFESLVGKFSDGRTIDDVPLSERRVLSIKDNLDRIFNTREGLLPHLKGYGLPDISEIYRTMPHGVEKLEAAIKSTVMHHEPRLKNIKLERARGEENRFKLDFTISGEVPGIGRITFKTSFSSNGQSSIGPWKKI